MTRGRGEGSYSQLSDRRWVYQLSVGIGPDGKRQRPRFYGETKAAALEAAEDYKRRLRDGVPVLGGEQRLGDYLDGWLAGLVRAPATLAAYRTLIDLHIRTQIGRTALSGLTAPSLRRWQRSLLDAGRSPSTANAAHVVLGAAMADAERDGIVPRNPVRLVRRLPVARSERTGLTLAQVNQLFEYAADTRYGPLYVVAVGLGLRQGEILGLQWSDLEDGTLHVRRQLSRDYGAGASLAGLKTGDSGRRALPMPRFVVDALERQRERQAFEKVMAGNEWVDVGDLIFRTPHGRPMQHNTVSKAFNRARADLGLPSTVTFHSLRHSCATLLLASGVDMRTVQIVLGHGSMRTTEIYAHVLPGLMTDAFGRLDGLFGA